MNTARRWINWQIQKILPDPGQSYQRVELDQVVFEEIEWRADERVLDVGCYQGVSSSGIADRVGSVVAVDISPAALRGIRHARISPACADGQALPFTGASFDTVFCHLVANLFPQPAAAAREFVRCLAPGGRIIISVSNLHAPYQRLNRLMERTWPRCNWATLVRSQNHWPARRWIEAFEGLGAALDRTYSCNLGWPLIPRLRGRWIIPNRLMWCWSRAARRISALPVETVTPHFAAHDYLLVFVKRKNRRRVHDNSNRLNGRSPYIRAAE